MHTNSFSKPAGLRHRLEFYGTGAFNHLLGESLMEKVRGIHAVNRCNTAVGQVVRLAQVDCLRSRLQIRRSVRWIARDPAGWTAMALESRCWTCKRVPRQARLIFE